MTVLYLIAAILIIAADQAVKLWVSSAASVGEVIGGIPHFAELLYVKNTGAAFSAFSGKVSALSVVSVVFCIGVIVYWIAKKPKHPLLKASVMLMFAGAAGNAIDRIRLGYVVDYINLKFMNFPVFNIADIAITVGAALLVLYVILFDKGGKPE